MPFEDLNNDNFLMYSMKAYDKPNCLMSEFKEDMKRFNYLKRLFHKYRKNNEIKEQLILNHLIVIYNVFGVETSTRMLFYKVSKEDFPTLKTFLLFLNYMPNIVHGIKGEDIRSSDIEVDLHIAELLRKIKMKTIKEDGGMIGGAVVPANNVGSGNIAGLGVGKQGEPGVNKKNKKKVMPFKTFTRNPPSLA